MITFVLIFIGLCLILEIKPIKKFLRGKDPDQRLIDNIEKHEKKEKHTTRTGGLHSDYKYGEANNKKK